MPMFDRTPQPPLEAVQWTGDNLVEIQRELACSCYVEDLADGQGPVFKLLCGVDGSQGWVPVPHGSWIAKNSPTDFYPIDPDYFATHFADAAPVDTDEDEGDMEGDDDDIVRAKWTIDGATTLAEAAELAHKFAAGLQDLHDQGFVLREPIHDDYGFIYNPQSQATA